MIQIVIHLSGKLSLQNIFFNLSSLVVFTFAFINTKFKVEIFDFIFIFTKSSFIYFCNSDSSETENEWSKVRIIASFEFVVIVMTAETANAPNICIRMLLNTEDER